MRDQAFGRVEFEVQSRNGVILRDFSPEVSGAPRHNCRLTLWKKGHKCIHYRAFTAKIAKQPRPGRAGPVQEVESEGGLKDREGLYRWLLLTIFTIA